MNVGIAPPGELAESKLISIICFICWPFDNDKPMPVKNEVIYLDPVVRVILESQIIENEDVLIVGEHPAEIECHLLLGLCPGHGEFVRLLMLSAVSLFDDHVSSTLQSILWSMV